MKENLMVICYDYGLSRRISKSLADFLDMRLFDMLEMFIFNNAPHKLTDVIKINGEEYAIKKMFAKKLVILPTFSIKAAAFFTKFLPRKLLIKIVFRMQSKKIQ